MYHTHFLLACAAVMLAAPAAAQPSSDFLVREDDPFAAPKAAQTARAEDDTPPPAGASQPGSANPLYDAGKAHPPAAPDDTRGWEEEPGPSDEDIVLAVPRALLFLPNLALKTVFLPLRGLATLIDEYALVERTKELLYFNDARTAGIFPTASAQTAHGLSLGARIFHNDLFGHKEHISARATIGGLYQQGYQLLFEGNEIGGSSLWMEARLRYEKKPGLLFYGLGDAPDGSMELRDVDPRAASVPTRYRQERLLGLLRMGPTLGGPGNLTQVGATTAYNRRVFGSEAHDYTEPSVGTVYDTSKIEGFHDTLHLVEVDLNVNHDSTDHPEFPSDGVFMELFAGRVFSFEDYTFWHSGAEVAGFINLYRGDRVLVLRAAVESVNGEPGDIPFSELPRLGGSQRLRGYVQDRFRDKISTVATLEYRYPVHDFVSGHLFVDSGRVGSSRSKVFGTDAYEHWRTGAGGGFTVHSQNREDVFFRIELGYGDGFTALFSTEPLRAFSKRSRQL